MYMPMARTRRSGFQQQLRRTIRTIYHAPKLEPPIEFYEEFLKEFDLLIARTTDRGFPTNDLRIVYENLTPRKPTIRQIEIVIPPLKIKLIPIITLE